MEGRKLIIRHILTKENRQISKYLHLQEIGDLQCITAVEIYQSQPVILGHAFVEALLKDTAFFVVERYSGFRQKNGKPIWRRSEVLI